MHRRRDASICRFFWLRRRTRRDAFSQAVLLQRKNAVADLVQHLFEIVLQLHQRIHHVIIRIQTGGFRFGARLGDDLVCAALGL